MPGGSFASAPHRLERVIAELDDAFAKVRAPWAIIGGIAVIAHGVRRMTADIDAVVLGGTLAIEDAVSHLETFGFTPRLDNAIAFARENLVLLIRHASGVDVDLSFGWTEFETRAIAASRPTAFGRTFVPIVEPRDLLTMKLMAGRPIDLEDSAALLLLHPSIDLGTVRRDLDTLAALADAPELAEGLDRILREVGTR